MSYDSKDLSVQDASPVWLVRFVQGSITYRYTTLSETINRDVGDGSVAWYAYPITVGKISSSGNVSREPLTITLPYNNPLAATFVGYTPDTITTVTVWRTHYDDVEVRCMWKGRVLTPTFNVGVASLTCESIFSAIKRGGPAPCYTRACRFAFTKRGCNLSPTSYTHALTATSAVGAVVVVTDAGDYNLVWGSVIYNGVERMIVAQSGDTLTLTRWHKPLSLALAGGSVSVSCIEGCERTVAACRTKGNLGAFGGQPGIPAINPMSANIMTLR